MCNAAAMKTRNQFHEYALAVGSASKAARIIGIEKTRFWRLTKGSVPVQFDELDRIRIALESISVAREEMGKTA